MMDVWCVKQVTPPMIEATVIYLDRFLEHQRENNLVQHIKSKKDVCFVTVLRFCWVSSRLPPVDPSEHLPRWGLGQGLIGTLERGHPVKRTPVGLFCAAVESCSPPNPQEPPVAATGKWGVLKEVGVGCALECVVDRLCRIKAEKSDCDLTACLKVCFRNAADEFTAVCQRSQSP